MCVNTASFCGEEYIVVRGRWCSIIVLNVHAPREERSDDTKDSFYEEIEQVFELFPRYHMKILLESFSEKVGRVNIFKLVIAIESLEQDNNVNGFRIVNSSASKNVPVKITMFQHRNIRKYNWTSPGEKTYNQIDHVLIDRRWHLSVLDVRSCRLSWLWYWW